MAELLPAAGIMAMSFQFIPLLLCWMMNDRVLLSWNVCQFILTELFIHWVLNEPHDNGRALSCEESVHLEKPVMPVFST